MDDSIMDEAVPDLDIPILGQLPPTPASMASSNASSEALKPAEGQQGILGVATPRPAASTTPVPTTPEEVNDKSVFAFLTAKKKSGDYLRPAYNAYPFTPYAPLAPENRHKETRPCHCSFSRLHLLQCGHYVVTPETAEQCAPNCAGMLASPCLRSWARKSMDDKEVLMRQHPFAAIPDPDTGGVFVYPGMSDQKHKPRFDRPQFGCLLCVRTALALLDDAEYKTPLQWINLYDPKYLDEANEAASLAGLRSCQIAHFSRKPGVIVPVRDLPDLAVVKTLEKMRLQWQSSRPVYRPTARLEAKHFRREERRELVAKAKAQRRAAKFGYEPKPSRRSAPSKFKSNPFVTEEDDMSMDEGDDSAKASVMASNSNNADISPDPAEAPTFDFKDVPKEPKAKKPTKKPVQDNVQQGPQAKKLMKVIKAGERSHVAGRISKPPQVPRRNIAKNAAPDEAKLRAVEQIVRNSEHKDAAETAKEILAAIDAKELTERSKKLERSKAATLTAQKKKERAINQSRREEKRRVLGGILDEGLAELADKMDLSMQDDDGEQGANEG